MIVLVLSVCPPSLRGDVTRWLFEISTNVFVGRVSARVRDQLWDRVVRSCENGQATMVYTANNEQRFDYRIHNSNREILDLDGIKVMLTPSAENKDCRNTSEK